MVKIAIIGDTEDVKGFGAVGVDIFPVTDYKSAAEKFKALSGGEYGIIFITEEYAVMLNKEIRKFDESIIPAVIPVPGVKGNTGLGIARLKQSVEKAVGSDIVFNK